MRIVIDTNIFFSALINSKGTISDLIFNSDHIFDFFAPSTLFDEINKHREKLIKVSKLSKEEINELQLLLISKINRIEIEQIQMASWEKAIELTKKIDEFDAPFIALTIEIRGTLWTGDKKLLNGLQQLDYGEIIDTSNLFQIRSEMDAN